MSSGDKLTDLFKESLDDDIWGASQTGRVEGPSSDPFGASQIGGVNGASSDPFGPSQIGGVNGASSDPFGVSLGGPSSDPFGASQIGGVEGPSSDPFGASQIADVGGTRTDPFGTGGRGPGPQGSGSGPFDPISVPRSSADPSGTGPRGPGPVGTSDLSSGSGSGSSAFDPISLPESRSAGPFQVGGWSTGPFGESRKGSDSVPVRIDVPSSSVPGTEKGGPVPGTSSGPAVRGGPFDTPGSSQAGEGGAGPFDPVGPAGTVQIRGPGAIGPSPFGESRTGATGPFDSVEGGPVGDSSVPGPFDPPVLGGGAPSGTLGPFDLNPVRGGAGGMGPTTPGLGASSLPVSTAKVPGPFDVRVTQPVPSFSGSSSTHPVQMSSPLVQGSPLGKVGFSVDDESPPRPLSAIAARRSQGAQELIQPEQDVIYKQYNPNPPTTPPPPPIAPLNTPASIPRGGAAPSQGNTNIPLSTSSPGGAVHPHGHTNIPLGLTSPGGAVHPHGHANIPLGVTGGAFPTQIQPQFTPGPGPMGRSPVSRFVYESPPQPFQREMTSAVEFPSQAAPSAVLLADQPRQERGGLRVFCTIGFGGRVIMGGGRFGTKMSLCTLRDAFRGKSFLREIESIPSPLGSVSDLVTEQVIAYCDSRSSAEQGVSHGDSGRSSWLMWKYLGHQVRRSRENFLTSIWEQAVQEHGIETKSVLYEYMSRVVEGNLREALKIASERAPELHAVSMAIASIHSPEFFREAVLQYANSMTANPYAQSLIPGGPLLEVVQMTITVFASTSAIDNLFISREDHFVQYWKLYLCAIACLIRPSGTTVSGGVAFLVKLGELLASRNQVSEGHLCMLISGKVQSLDSVDSSNALMCLVGANHRDIGHFHRLLDPEALHMSEVLEYSKRLSQQSPLFVPLQPWKYAYASMLASDLGLFELAEKYIDVINAFIRAVPTGKYSVHFRNGMRELESRIHESCGRKPPEVATAASTLSSLFARIL